MSILFWHENLYRQILTTTNLTFSNFIFCSSILELLKLADRAVFLTYTWWSGPGTARWHWCSAWEHPPGTTWARQLFPDPSLEISLASTSAWAPSCRTLRNLWFGEKIFVRKLSENKFVKIIGFVRNYHKIC